MEEQKENRKKKKGLILFYRKNKKNRKSILLLLLLMLFTAVLLSTSTFAWFTTNKSVTVNDIQVNVAAQNGIQISVDGSKWKSIIQTSDITAAHSTYAASVNQVPSSMEPVSTIGNIDSTGKMEMYYGVVDSDTSGNYTLTATKETEVEGTTGKFVAFDLFFKIDQAVNLKLSGGVTVPSGSTDLGIQNASRMAFVVLGNTPSGSPVTTIQALNNGTSSAKYIWELNADKHKDEAITHALDNYNITTTDGSVITNYYGVKAPIETGVALSSTDSAYFGLVTPNYQTTAAQNGVQFDMFSLQAGITKVRIYMWIEGQDIDCENSASGGNIIYTLQVTIPES